MFQPGFQAGMQAKAGRTLASSAGWGPALTERVGETRESRRGCRSVGQGFAWVGTGCRQLGKEVCVGGVCVLTLH